MGDETTTCRLQCDSCEGWCVRPKNHFADGDADAPSFPCYCAAHSPKPPLSFDDAIKVAEGVMIKSHFTPGEWRGACVVLDALRAHAKERT